MAAAASIKVVKHFTYRGSVREWSNRYYISDGAPADSTKWTTMSDAIVTAEKAAFMNQYGYQIVATYGYAPGSDVPVFSKTYATNGTLSIATYTLVPGDVAGLVRYSTATRTSKNHPLYLFNYYHAVVGSSAGTPDELASAQRTALGTYASNWITGFSDGVVSHHRCGPNGDLATGQLVNLYLRHRDFPAG